ncbi:MAG TPA: L-2-hydroxyglutarate oxidase, partial [Bryobacteraceae bacterium]
MSTDDQFDVVVVGAGIVGLSAALHLRKRFPHLRLTVLEKEPAVGSHQSGHNSGVIHSGIYYKPGSFKARMCVEGAAEMVQFCGMHDIPFDLCGKLIVATNAEELAALEELFKRGNANGVRGIRKVPSAELQEIEPNCSGLAGLHVPSTGVTDFRQVCSKLQELLQAAGCLVRLSSRVQEMRRINHGFVLETTSGDVTGNYVVNCAGLYSDVIARMGGGGPAIRIMPFRGEYYELVRERRGLVRALIYPVPDRRFPFLGVHFTRRISGSVDAGPNAVLAFKREGYRKGDFSYRDSVEAFRFPGLWRLAAKYWRSGLDEFNRSLRKTAFVRALQRMVPSISASDLISGQAGVRAQAVTVEGTLVDDFHFDASLNLLNVLNVPSPAATASLPIGRAIAEMAARIF